MSQASATFKVENLDNKHDIKAVKCGLDTLRGVTSVSAGNKRVAVDYNTADVDIQQILHELSALGFRASAE